MRKLKISLPRPTANANMPEHIHTAAKQELTAEEYYEQKCTEHKNAIDTLSAMCLDDDDMAIVVVASPYRRLNNIALIIDGSTIDPHHENMQMLADTIRGTEVERFINSYFVNPRVCDAIGLCEMENKKCEREAYESGKHDEFERIVNLLKGGDK